MDMGIDYTSAIALKDISENGEIGLKRCIVAYSLVYLHVQFILNLWKRCLQKHFSNYSVLPDFLALDYYIRKWHELQNCKQNLQEHFIIWKCVKLPWEGRMWTSIAPWEPWKGSFYEWMKRTVTCFWQTLQAKQWMLYRWVTDCFNWRRDMSK